MIKITVKNTQSAKEKIKRELWKLFKNKTILVGMQEDAGEHKSEDGSDDISNAELGAILHYGTATIPARPWLDVGVESGSKEYIDILKNNVADLDNALEIVGAVAVGKVQQYMTDLREPPNAASTVKKKGSNNPLIDTGELRQSITYKIINGKPTEGVL